MEIFSESKYYMDEFLKDDLENNVDYEDPELQTFLYWLAVMLRDVMAISLELRERHDMDIPSGGMVIRLNHLLERIETLWPEKQNLSYLK